MYEPVVGNLFLFGTYRTILYDYTDGVKLTNNAPAVTSPLAFFGTNGVLNLDLTAHITDVETPGSNLIYSVIGSTGGIASLQSHGQKLQFTPSVSFDDNRFGSLA